MLIAAGHVTGEIESDDQLLEPEMRLFFRDVWSRMSEEERGVVRNFIEVLTVRVRR